LLTCSGLITCTIRNNAKNSSRPQTPALTRFQPPTRPAPNTGTRSTP
jgi:hypothetical protein